MRPTSIDRPLFDRLARETGDPLVSVYLPTHTKGAEIQQERIRLKNAITEVDGWLAGAGWNPRQRTAHLADVTALLDDRDFWEHQSEGLGILVDATGAAAPIALPEGAQPCVVVSGTYHLRPMIRSLERIELPVLVLTLHGVRLYRASRHHATRVEADLPTSFEDVNWFVDREKQRQHHPDRSGTARSRHGHDPAEDRVADLERFLGAVADALPHFEHKETLIVLGDDNLVARFRQIHHGESASTHNGGLHDVDSAAVVHDKVAALVVAQESAIREKRLEVARDHLGIGHALVEVAEALKAAASALVSQLVLHHAADAVWGRFDSSTLEITEHSTQGFGDVDLLDRMAVHAMTTGADVATVDEPVNGRGFVAVPRF